jgi:hypothetical protein
VRFVGAIGQRLADNLWRGSPDPTPSGFIGSYWAFGAVVSLVGLVFAVAWGEWLFVPILVSGVVLGINNTVRSVRGRRLESKFDD